MEYLRNIKSRRIRQKIWLNHVKALISLKSKKFNLKVNLVLTTNKIVIKQFQENYKSQLIQKKSWNGQMKKNYHWILIS